MSEAQASRTPRKVIFVVGSPGSTTVFKGEAIVDPDNIYIFKTDNKGRDWLRDRHLAESIELCIKSQPGEGQRREILSDGFALFSYLNPQNGEGGRPVAFLRVEHPFSGTPLHRNYQRMNTDRVYWYVDESVLYSDSRFIGQIDNLGPYSIINGLPSDRPVMPALYLRTHIHHHFSVMMATCLSPSIVHTRSSGSIERERSFRSRARWLPSLLWRQTTG